MTARMPAGLDFVATRLHARRSRLAEAGRLDALCRVRQIAELARMLYSDSAVDTAVELQRRMVSEMVKELAWLAEMFDGPQGDLLDWLSARFQIENLKVLARAFAVRADFADIQPLLVPVPGGPALDAKALVAAESVEQFGALVPMKPIRKAILAAAEFYDAMPRPFFIESAVDQGYFTELLARVDALSEGDREEVVGLARLEVDIFQLMLVVRGRLHYNLKPEQVLAFCVKGAGLRRDTVAAMAGAADLAGVVAKAVGPVFPTLPREVGAKGSGHGNLDAVTLEALAWNRYLVVASHLFRRSHMGLGAVVAYVAIRRVEVANLITLTEGIRTGMAPEEVRKRLFPRADLEAAHV